MEFINPDLGQERLRVIAGKYRSRLLRPIRGLDIRPTADRLRETLFDVLCAGEPDAMEGAVWLDLFAGTGAVGIEAISRGAGAVYFVESSPEATALIRQNLQALDIRTGFEILQQDVFRAGESLARRGIRADVVFLDPPYRMENAYSATLELISRLSLTKKEGIVVSEHHKKFDLPDRVGSLARYRTLKQGDAALSFYRSENVS